MYLLRVLLIFMIFYLLLRAFRRDAEEERQREQAQKKMRKSHFPSGRKISKAIGEYIDFQESEKKKLR